MEVQNIGLGRGFELAMEKGDQDARNAEDSSATQVGQELVFKFFRGDAIELGDAKVFSGAVPNCLIWRFELGCRERTLRYAEIGAGDPLPNILAAPPWEERHFIETAGQLMFSREKHALPLKALASVKVGAVSGADEIYADTRQGNRDFVCSSTRATGKTRRMIWVGVDDPPPACLLPHKSRLIARGIRPFDETNWWQWGRGYPENNAPRSERNA